MGYSRGFWHQSLVQLLTVNETEGLLFRTKSGQDVVVHYSICTVTAKMMSVQLLQLLWQRCYPKQP